MAKAEGENKYSGKIENFDPKRAYFFTPNFYLYLLPDNLNKEKSQERDDLIQDYLKEVNEIKNLSNEGLSIRHNLDDNLRQLNELYMLISQYLESDDIDVQKNFIHYFGALHDYITGIIRQGMEKRKIEASKLLNHSIQEEQIRAHQEDEFIKSLAPVEQFLYESGVSSWWKDYKKERSEELTEFLNKFSRDFNLYLETKEDDEKKMIENLLGLKLFKQLYEFDSNRVDVVMNNVGERLKADHLNALLTKLCLLEIKNNKI